MTTQSQSRFIPRQLPYNTYNISVPDKQTLTESVSRIFLNAADGNSFAITQAIMQEKTSLHLQDMEKKTIIHYILINKNLTNKEKYDLTKLVVKYGAPIDLSDSRGIKPLHLASNVHNIKVLELLLRRGADPNSTDNNFMTPLHYSVLPETHKCREITRLLQPKKKSLTSLNDMLYKEILDVMNKDEIAKMYIDHLKGVFESFSIYSDKESEYLKELDIINAEQIGGGGDRNDKISLLKKKIHNDTIKSISKTLTTKINFGSNDEGWGPNDSKKQITGIMPFKNLKEVFDESYEPFKVSCANLFKELESKIGEVDKRIGELKKYIVDLSDLFMNLFLVSHIVHDVKKLQKIHNSLKNITQEKKTYLKLNNNKMPYIHFDTKNSDNTIRNVGFPLLENYSKFSTYDNTTNEHGFGFVMANIVKMMGDINEKIQREKTSLMVLINKGIDHNLQKTAIMYICNIQIYIMNICYCLLLFESYSNIINELLDIICNAFMQEYEEYKAHIDYYYSLTQGAIPIRNKNFTVAMSATVTPVFASDDGTNYLDNVFNVYLPNSDGKTYKKIETRVEGGNRDEKIKNLKELYKKIDSLRKKGEKGNNINIITLTYNSVVELQEKVNTLIDSYNKLNGYIFLLAFNNDFSDECYKLNEIKSTKNVLYTKIKKLREIPKKHSVFSSEIGIIPIDSVEDKNIKNIMEKYAYEINDDNMNIIVYGAAFKGKKGKIYNIKEHKLKSALVVPRLNESGAIAGGALYKSNDNTNYTDLVLYGGDVKGNGVIATIDHITGKRNTVLINKWRIISTVIDDHVNLIRHSIIMKLLNELKNGDKQKTYFDKIGTIVGTQKQKHVYLKNCAKIINDIVIATINKLSLETAKIYVSDLQNYNPNERNKDLADLFKPPAIPPAPPAPVAPPAAPALPVAAPPAAAPAPAPPLPAKIFVLPPEKSGHLQDHDVISRIEKNKDGKVLQYFGKTIEDKDKTNEKHLISHENSSLDVCYTIDSSTISTLIKHGANPNAYDRTGQTPLTMALLLQDQDIIHELIKDGAKVKVNNMNAYEMCYQQLLDIIEASPFISIDDINSKVEEHIMDITKMTSIYSNSKLILQMALYLLDHQMTSYASSYPNNWNYDDHQSILNKLNITLSYKILPLALIDQDIFNSIIGQATKKDLRIIQNQNIAKYNDLLARITSSITNLDKEIAELSKDPVNNKGRIDELNKLKDKLNENQTSITLELSKYTGINIVDIDTSAQKTALIQALETDNFFDTGSRNICKVYDKLFNKISTTPTNTEYAVYLRLWNALLNKHKEGDQTQLPRKLQQMILVNGVLEPDVFTKSFDKIINLYEKVLSRYGRDYLELSTNLDLEDESYTSNYAMNQIFCIMTHIFKHTISYNLMNTVAHYFIKQDIGIPEEDAVKHVYDLINDSKFIENCVNYLPKQVVKVVCKIYESDDDPDRKISVRGILDKLFDLLPMDKNAISGAKETIIPFFSEYVSSYVAEMHSCMVKQIKLYIIQSNMLNILKLLAEQAIKENL